MMRGAALVVCVWHAAALVPRAPSCARLSGTRGPHSCVAPPIARSVRGRAGLRAVRIDLPLLRTSSPLARALPRMLGVLSAAAALVAGAFAASIALPLLLSGAAADGDEQGEETLFGALRASFRHRLRCALGSFKAFCDNARLSWTEAFDERSLTTLPDAWAPCGLESREEFGEWGEGVAYTAYRFSLKSGDQSVLPLELGQEVTVMCLDGKNRVVRASFPLASSRREPGAIEIVVPSAERREARFAVGGLSAEQLAVASALDALSVGGEAAVRPGRRAFAYEGDHLPITSLHCFVEELGALPAIQLLKESLPRGRSTVERAELYWINSCEEDLALYEGLEEVYYQFSGKMALNCVVDDQLHAAALATATAAAAGKKPAAAQQPRDSVFKRNDDLRESVQVWEPGMLGVVSGPPHFNAEVAQHLTQQLGYPQDCVLFL